MAIRFQYQVPAGMVGAYASGQAGARRRQRKYEIDLLSQQQRHAQRMAELAARRGALGRRGAAGGGGRLVDPLSAGSKYHGSAWGTMTPDTTGTAGLPPGGAAPSPARPLFPPIPAATPPGPRSWPRSVKAAPIDRKKPLPPGIPTVKWSEEDYARWVEEHADTPPGPRSWPRSVKAAPIGKSPPSEDALREGMRSKKGGTYYAIPGPIKPKKPLDARDAAAERMRDPKGVAKRAKRAGRGASDPAAAAPAGTPGTATPSVAPGTPGVTMVSDGGAMVDPVATHPAFAAPGAPLTRVQEKAQRKLRVQQRAQAKAYARDRRLGKTPTNTDLLPYYVSPEQIAQQQERAEVLEKRKYDADVRRTGYDFRAEESKKTRDATDLRTARYNARAQIDGLEMPEMGDPADLGGLREAKDKLREFLITDVDLLDPGVQDAFHDAILDYQNKLAAIKEKDPHRAEREDTYYRDARGAVLDADEPGAQAWSKSRGKPIENLATEEAKAKVEAYKAAKTAIWVKAYYAALGKQNPKTGLFHDTDTAAKQADDSVKLWEDRYPAPTSPVPAPTAGGDWSGFAGPGTEPVAALPTQPLATPEAAAQPAPGIPDGAQHPSGYTPPEPPTPEAWAIEYDSAHRQAMEESGLDSMKDYFAAPEEIKALVDDRVRQLTGGSPPETEPSAVAPTEPLVRPQHVDGTKPTQAVPGPGTASQQNPWKDVASPVPAVAPTQETGAPDWFSLIKGADDAESQQEFRQLRVLYGTSGDQAIRRSVAIIASPDSGKADILRAVATLKKKGVDIEEVLSPSSMSSDELMDTPMMNRHIGGP